MNAEQASFPDPMAPVWQATLPDYLTDAWQRGILFADVMRQRGNQYRARLEERTPNVLDFPFEAIMSGAELPRPVNYWLVRILPPDGVETDNTKRPFVVIDPRAGHGPGIGGFKPDSEIGDAMKAGHPCYFVGFLPDPVPGQTVEDVMRAEAAFLRKVIELHPRSHGRPAVIGNCQAGWQVLMTASVWPELFGPIIVAGTPVSYWAGDNPMRYAGGMLGGSWMTALTGDIGAGRFDGAWLVMNFENLDPANTLWTKQYNVYSKVDTEGPRYLDFEKYWGGHVFLNAVEMQYIVDNLFVGNRLATAELMTSDGVRIDLRNIRSPIVVFCSYGDNITPPGQALGWITDLYRDDDDLISRDQTIVYATHDSIGHLGIFVSSSVGRKEHREFTSNIDLIDLLPAGLYQSVIADHPEDVPTEELTDGKYLMTIEQRSLEDVRAIVKSSPEKERPFAAVTRLSELNLALYRNFMQPWVQAVSTPASARWLQAMHPLRINFEWWNDQHPLAGMVEQWAGAIRAARQPVAADNPWLRVQESTSAVIEQVLDRYRDHRDQITAILFDTLYRSPLMMALAGQSMSEPVPPRQHPGESPEQRAYAERESQHLVADIPKGGLPEAVVRAVFYVLRHRGEADERHFRHAARLLWPEGGTAAFGFNMSAFRKVVRRQALLMRLHATGAVAAIPTLLEGVPADKLARVHSALIDLTATSKLTDDEQKSLAEVLALFPAQPSSAPLFAGDQTPVDLPRPAPPPASAKTAKAAKQAAGQARAKKPAAAAGKPVRKGAAKTPTPPARNRGSEAGLTRAKTGTAQAPAASLGTPTPAKASRPARKR